MLKRFLRAGLLLGLWGCLSEQDLWELPLLRTSSTAAVHVRRYAGVSLAQVRDAARRALRSLMFEIVDDDLQDGPVLVVDAHRGEQSTIRLTAQMQPPREIEVGIQVRPLDQGLAAELHSELARQLFISRPAPD